MRPKQEKHTFKLRVLLVVKLSYAFLDDIQYVGLRLMEAECMLGGNMSGYMFASRPGGKYGGLMESPF